MDESTRLEEEIDEGDSDLVVAMKTALKQNPELLSLTFCTKNGIMIKTSSTVRTGRLQSTLLSILCDKARAVAREFEFKDEVKFMSLRTSKTEFMVYVDRRFLMIGSHKPSSSDEGEPVIDFSGTHE